MTHPARSDTPAVTQGTNALLLESVNNLQWQAVLQSLCQW